MEESVSVTQSSWVEDAIKKGLILAIIHIVVFLIVYYVFPEKLTGMSYAAFILVFNLAFCFVSGNQWRNQVGGYIDFGNAFKYVFVIFVASGVIQTIFSVIFLYIEPSFPEVMAQSQIDTSVYWAQKFGAPDESLEKMNEEFDPEELAERYKLSSLPLRFGLGLIFYAIGAAIIGLIVRKREPESF
jgi:hypothetical protein